MGVSSEVMEVREASEKYDLQAAEPVVPFGYKQTEVGVIPEDWEVKTVAEIGTIKTGPFGTLLKASEYSGADGVPLISVGEIGAGSIKLKEHTPKVPAIVVRRLPQYVLRTGDIVFGRKGAVERSALVTEKENGWFLGSDGISVRPYSLCNSSYLACQFQKQNVQNWLLQHAIGTTMPSLNQKVLSLVQVPCAPLPEQRAIATALCDMDALLDGLNWLIAKKRDLKQATMQQLLTGQTRLPGFEGGWEVKRLGDHLTFLRNGVNSRAELTRDDPVKYLHYGDIHACNAVMISAAPLPSLPSAKAKMLDRLRDGDLIFADASEDLDGVSKSVEIYGASDTELVAGLHTIAVRFDKNVLADGFKSYLQFCPAFSGHLRRLAAGTKVYATNRSHIASVEIRLPPIEEQLAIATVLSDMDAEIEALEQRRHKTRDLKQAMMQELLTGRTRLIKPLAQEPVEDKAEPHEKKANVYFMRSVLAAEIIDQLHQEPTFGHVKFEKMLFLVEHLCEVDTGSTYRRQAAGPYDNKALRSIDSQLLKQQWFEACKEGGRYRYVPLNKQGGHKTYFARYYFGISADLKKIVETFRALDTERCEIVATLFSAWSDLLRDNDTVSDDMIVHEVLNHWHESKKRIAEERWLSALGWMRDKGFVPKGSSA